MLNKPDFHQTGLVNLMSSLVAGMGGVADHSPLDMLPPAEVAARRAVLLFVIDGLGYEFLQRFEDSFLYSHLRGRLSTVFPSTTASAISTYLSALAPGKHGLTGWFTYLRELGSVAAVLPFQPRHGGPTYDKLGLDIKMIVGWPSVFDRLNVECCVVSPNYIVNSPFSAATSGAASRHGYNSLEEFFATSKQLIKEKAERRYVYAYWPKLDTMMHQHGVSSDVVEAQFREIDDGMREFVTTSDLEDVLVMVSADHGAIDTTQSSTVALEKHPRLASMLTLPLCGEPRAAYCYVRATKQQSFVDYVNDNLTEKCWLVSSEQLVDEGFFGEPPYHPRLYDRIGDYALIMKDNFVIKDRLLGEPEFRQIGVHGGVSSAEMYVPLIVVNPLGEA